MYKKAIWSFPDWWNRFLVREITRERLALYCRILFFASIVPLIMVALYSYPADDDFGFTLPAAAAWTQTHSLLEVLKAIIVKTRDIYVIWQGDFVSTLFFQINPMIFNIRLYFLCNWYILGLLCLSVGYLLKALIVHSLKASRATFWIVYSSVMALVLQFMPSIGESIYWYNGGQYTVTAAFLMLTLGMLVKSAQTSDKKRRVMLAVFIAFFAFLLGGSFYGPALASFVILLQITLICWIKRSKVKGIALTALISFGIAFFISISAPGNLNRQSVIGQHGGAVQAIVASVLDSFDMTGKWITPQLFAVMLLIIPVMWKPLKESQYSFRHPFLFLLMLYMMYASSLTPGIYTGYGYTGNRYLNMIYFLFLIMSIGSVLYGEGRFIRWLESRQSSPASYHLLQATENLGQRFCLLYLVFSMAFITLGGFSSTIMNIPSINATKVLISGEAAVYQQEMQERQEYILVTDSDSVAIKTLSVTIPIFKGDRLPFQGIYGRVRYMKQYFELFNH